MAEQCAPSVHVSTLLSVAHAESRFNPLAIGVNGARPRSIAPADKVQAVRTAQALISSGANLDLGLGQINVKNLAWLNLSVADAFEPGLNLKSSAKVLAEGYGRVATNSAGADEALRSALSIYNTGHPSRGVRNGYVARVQASARRIVPAINVAADRATLPQASDVSVEPPSPTPQHWDVFGRARLRASTSQGTGQ
ncbi:MAG: lytic transglycosylase domain-containing protein [Caulobacter sp.]